MDPARRVRPAVDAPAIERRTCYRPNDRRGPRRRIRSWRPPAGPAARQYVWPDRGLPSGLGGRLPSRRPPNHSRSAPPKASLVGAWFSQRSCTFEESRSAGAVHPAVRSRRRRHSFSPCFAVRNLGRQANLARGVRNVSNQAPLSSQAPCLPASEARPSPPPAQRRNLLPRVTIDGTRRGALPRFIAFSSVQTPQTTWFQLNKNLPRVFGCRGVPVSDLNRRKICQARQPKSRLRKHIMPS